MEKKEYGAEMDRQIEGDGGLFRAEKEDVRRNRDERRILRVTDPNSVIVIATLFFRHLRSAFW